MPQLTRRRTLQALLSTYAAGLISRASPALAFGRREDTTTRALTLWYTQPAARWEEALPVGNGRIGAMVFGDAIQERLQLNEDTLWAGGPYDPSNQDALRALPEVRSLVFAGRYADALKLADASMMSKPLRQMSYQNVGDLLLSFAGAEGQSLRDYRRELNLDSATVTVSFRSGSTRYTRETFASPVDQVIVVRLTTDRRKALSFDATFRPPGANDSARVLVEDGDLVMRGRNLPQNGIAGALSWEARARIMTDRGQVSASPAALSVANANSATVLIAMATSYRNYEDTSGNPRTIVNAQLAQAARKAPARLRSDQLAEHRRLFRRVTLDLGTTAAASLPTDQRVRDSVQSDDPQLAALYYQFGRYLLISSSRPGTQPANLQGLWNDSMEPPWGSKYTININTQMNYWPAESAALGECVEPLVAMVRDLARSGVRTAQVNYGARGWVTHHNTDLWRATAPIDHAQSGMWPTGGAWLCTHLWEHYEYNRDRQYLAEVFPLMRGAAEFFLDTLVAEPRTGLLVTCPSMSPENSHPAGVSICAGPAMDRQILRDLFGQCIEAARILDVAPDFQREAQRVLTQLAPDRIGGQGQLQEWLDDWDMDVKELHHRHVSHLYGLFPSSQINLYDTPELTAAARRSLEIRGDNATGWGIGWRLNLWARLREGDHAHEVLKLLLGPQRTYPNLFDAHPPFQIDGNFGGTAGITQMLMQNYRGIIYLLPALPRVWQSGTIRGLRARGGFALDLEWSSGELQRAVVRRIAGATSSTESPPARLHYRDQILEVSPSASRPVTVGWLASRLTQLR
ncbi:MAG: glycosyl hydrolase family 95 catalytic domain-containing protein [Steroidobacteraceae bacterium]